MKRFISLLLCVIIAASSLIFALPSSAMLYRKGDINHDGTINAMDSYFLKTSIAGTAVGTDELASDTNSDGSVNSMDSYVMKLHLAGLGDIDVLYPEGCGWQGFTVMGTPISEYTVVVTNPDNANMVFAAEELSKYVRLGDGTTVLNIANGESDAEKQIILSEDTSGDMGTDGFNIRTEDDDVIITAGAKRGTMYAVYEILETYFGYSFYAYGEYKLDKNLKCDIPEGIDNTQIPHVRYRCVCITGFRNEYTESTVIKRKLSGCSVQSSMLKAKYGYGIERVRANAHSFDVFIPEEDMKAQGLSKRCLSDSRSFEICVENMLELLDERTAAGAVIGNEITEISCSYAADDEPCTCRNCNKVYREEGNQHSGLLCRFVNKVHAEIIKEYPDIRVIVNAYGNSADPSKGWHDAPGKTSLNEGITLLYCWNGCANHMLGKEGCSDAGNSLGVTNKKSEADFLAWTEKCSDIYVWYYPTHIYYMLCPEPNFDNLYNDFQWFINNGANGFYVVGTDGGSFESMDGQLIADMMWNPDMTKEEYDLRTAEYLKDNYGYGWTYIREYMDMLIECGDLKGCVFNDFELPFDIYSKDYFKDNYDKMCDLFDKAMEETDSDEERYNLEKLSVHMHFLGLSALYEDRYVNGTEAQREAYAAQWEWTYNFINDNDMPLTYSTNGIDSPFTLDINPLNQAYPDIGDGER
ncbi:MAG: DUF4838 domain-containing protein [Ruminococcaceae bacterium]|nr:DUF4838 domain-containing protein [Oscillospiraceae bacterium]